MKVRERKNKNKPKATAAKISIRSEYDETVKKK